MQHYKHVQLCARLPTYVYTVEGHNDIHEGHNDIHDWKALTMGILRNTCDVPIMRADCFSLKYRTRSGMLSNSRSFDFTWI